MLKNIIYLIIASLIIILAASFLKPGLGYLLNFYQWLTHLLEQVFSSGYIGKTLRNLLPLFLIPLIVGGVVSLVYSLIKRSQFPYFAALIWAIWIVLATLIVHNA